MASSKFLLLSLLSFLLTSATTASVGNAPVVPSSTTRNSSSSPMEFIRTSCSTTLYPALCFHSVARYASSVQNNPVLLARLAANVSLAHARSLSSHVSALLSRSSTTGREAALLHDCTDSLGDAVDQIKQSADEIGMLEAAPAGSEVAWRVSNAQTWMSAALTNEDTCADGFDGLNSTSSVKADVCGRVGRTKKYTSNALALVNSLVKHQ